jgi:hypothetical protein
MAANYRRDCLIVSMHLALRAYEWDWTYTAAGGDSYGSLELDRTMTSTAGSQRRFGSESPGPQRCDPDHSRDAMLMITYIHDQGSHLFACDGSVEGQSCQDRLSSQNALRISDWIRYGSPPRSIVALRFDSHGIPRSILADPSRYRGSASSVSRQSGHPIRSSGQLPSMPSAFEITPMG